MRNIQNKKGDIPITIFVIGVIAIFIFALVSYYISMNRTGGMIVNADAVEKMNVKIEQYNFYKNAKELSNDEIMSILEAKTDNLGKKYLYTEEVSGNKKIMSIQYYLP